jgi:4-hydroxy-3-methylbut-2-enyl diphosphate reductase
MEVLLADKAGFCFGVKRAVDEAMKAQKEYNKTIYTLGPLIHNQDVVEYLRQNDVNPIKLDAVESLNVGDTVIIRSHGVTPQVLETLNGKGVTVINATCPYVSNIQHKVKHYYDLGYSIVIVGDRNHPEVIGINGWCNNSAIIAKTDADLESLANKVCVVSQTTEKQESWQSVLNYIVKNCKEIIAFNTICNATEVRQKAAENISKNVDVMVVLGGFDSSNTSKLYEICKKNCDKTIHVENFSQIPEDFFSGKNIKKIGVTAGASTPEWIIKEAINKMSEINNTEINEQLAYMNEFSATISVGEKVKGTIISVNEKEAYVNIGYKADGYLPKAEVTKDDNTNLSDILKPGDQIEAKIVSRKNEHGYVVLSRLEIERDVAYEYLKTIYSNNGTIIVRIKEIVNGGLVAGYKGIRIFIPASLIDLYHVSNLDQYVNKEVEVKIVELKQDRKGTRIIGSRKELLQAEKSKKEEAAWETISEGSKVTGEVKRLTNFGAFVDVNGIDGLLHISEISWGRIEKASDALKIGDKIEVYVLSVDKENKKISLSIKKLTENPWVNAEAKYPVGNIVLGKVVRFASFGAFVELEPGIDGLVHISQISHKRIENPSEVLAIGQVVKAKIIEVNTETKKIGLSIKEAEEI